MALIRRKQNGALQVLASGTIVWDDDGPLGLTFSRSMLKELSDHAISTLGQPKSVFLALWGRMLTNEQFAELKREIQGLGEKYRRISDDNRRFRSPREIKHVSRSIIADHWDASVFARVTDV